MQLTPEILMRLQFGIYACGIIDPEKIGQMTATIARELNDDSPIIAPPNRDLLEQVKKLKAVAEAARELIDWLNNSQIISTEYGVVVNLEEALATLEGGEQDG